MKFGWWIGSGCCANLRWCNKKLLKNLEWKGYVCLLVDVRFFEYTIFADVFLNPSPQVAKGFVPLLKGERACEISSRETRSKNTIGWGMIPKQLRGGLHGDWMLRLLFFWHNDVPANDGKKQDASIILACPKISHIETHFSMFWDNLWKVKTWFFAQLNFRHISSS